MTDPPRRQNRYDDVINQFKKETEQKDKKEVSRGEKITKSEKLSKIGKKDLQKTHQREIETEKTADIVLKKDLPTRIKEFIAKPFHSSEKTMSSKKTEKKANEILTKLTNLTTKKQEKLIKSLDSYNSESRMKLEQSIVAKLNAETDKQKKESLINDLKDKYAYSKNGPLSSYFEKEANISKEIALLRELKDESNKVKKAQLFAKLKSETYIDQGPIHSFIQEESYKKFQGKNAFFQSAKLQEYENDMDDIIQTLEDHVETVPDDKQEPFAKSLDAWKELAHAYKDIAANKEYSEFFVSNASSGGAKEVTKEIHLSDSQVSDLEKFKSKLIELRERATSLGEEMKRIPESQSPYSQLPKVHNIQTVFLQAATNSLEKEVDQLLSANKSK